MIVAAFSLLAVAIFWAYLQYLDTEKRRKLPPGPKGYPLIGNILQLDVNRPWHTLVKWKELYGDIVYIRLVNLDVIVLNSAKAAGDLLDRRAANYSQRPRLAVFEYMTGGMLFAFINVGSMWRSMRRATHEALNVRASARYHPIQMREAVQLAMNLLQTPNNSLDHCHRFTSSGMASLLYNKPPAESSNDSTIDFLEGFIRVAAEATLPGTYLANHIPFLEHLPECLAKWKQESRRIYQYHEAKFLSFFLPVKEQVLRKEEAAPSFCATLVETHDRHSLNDIESSWLAAMLFLAGYETTASTLGWLLLAMIRFPEAQAKVHQELDEVVGRIRVPTLDDIQKLPYVRAVVKETLRWRPPVPMGVFHASREDDIYEGYYIPKGSFVIPNILSMNHDPETYGSCPDEFRPERFLNEDGTDRDSPPDTKDEGHYSFGFGRRICPGRHLAFNSLLTFAILLWAMHLDKAKEPKADGTEQLSTEDQGSGILSRPPIYKLSSRPRFPEAQEILSMWQREHS